ncbi:MAG TPA: 1,4-alpha-glucan branching protein domain-containing protein [Verrucomicrobiae bacterium]|nr:1,4-alpha-glucan branching protein domain-containing protein [Verrucomicrobiae bacterium]
MEKGLLSIILHAHLPFVRHPEHEYFLEENWFYEAITETYVPLINMFEGLEKDRVACRITMSLTPTLISMLRDGLLQDRYVRHIDKLIELANKEVERTRFQPEFNETALHYYWHFTQARETFVNRYGRDLTTAFKKFQDAGLLEIITCSATHAFLPLNHRTGASVRAQISTAVRQYEDVMGRRPAGIWLPECGYYPGVDSFLKEEGIRYFLVDTHGLLYASPRPKYGIFAPVYCPSGVAAFGRDVESSKQVWSAIEGYPGDADYREFYRDIGFDLDYDYIKPYISPDGLRVNTGIKYYRITGSNHKQPYVRSRAVEKAASHAGNFMYNREKQVEYLFEFLGRKPVIVAPYDAELYGHWWYEGPEFLNFLIRKVAFDQKTVRLATPSDYLREYPVNQVSTPSTSSWGYKGYAETWLNDTNGWIYKHLHKAALRMSELANRFKDQDPLKQRALNQAVRELFLAQSSDWAFIMHTGTMVPYAEKRTKDHILNFTKIYDDLMQNQVNESWLAELESRDNIFPKVDYHVFCGE